MRSLSALSLVLALGACAFGLPISPLVIKVSHSGNFLQGQTNAFYLIRVSNPGPTTSTGTVMVTDQAQSGLKITSLSGYGWNCSNVACWRSDSLAAGASYPAIMALATVDANAPPQFTHTATVHVDSTRYVTASDVTAIETNGYPIAWGTNYYGQMSVPAGLTNVVAVSAGGDHSLALKSDGTVVAWGEDWYGQTDVPKGLKNVVAVSAGGGQNLALTSDGTVVSWGANADRLRSLPLSVTKCATGYYCSPNRGHVVAIAAGGAHSLALKGDGTVVAWGQNYYGETNVPAGLKNVVAIAAGAYHSMALKSDGTVVDWPGNSVPAGLTNVVATAEGWSHNLALKSNGTVVAWGDDSYGQTKVPAGLTNVVAVAAGDWNSLALKSDGTVVSWGRDDAAQSTVPDGLASVFAIAGGGAYSLAVTSSPTSYIPVTFTATPCLPFEVDGKTYSGCPLQFDWAPGSSHTIATTSPQSSWWNWYFVPVGVMDGGQEIWTSWSDGGAMSHTVETPAAATTYTANFKTRFLLVTSVSPAGGGTIQPATGPTGAWYDENTVVTVTATPNPGYTFSGWWGGCYGNGPCQVTMQSPGAVIANFAPGP